MGYAPAQSQLGRMYENGRGVPPDIDQAVRLYLRAANGGNPIAMVNLGNLFVTALAEITGDFGLAIQLASKVLATRGRIYPVTTANATVIARIARAAAVGRRSSSPTRRVGHQLWGRSSEGRAPR